MNTALKRPPPVRDVVLAGVLCAALTWASATSASEDVGKKKADEACSACHGADGKKPVTPDTPRLGGQHYEYLVHALKDYRNGTRDNAVMSAMAKPLTENEIRDLAAYFSKQQGLTTKR